jgi:hypothetical protein
MTQGDDPDWGPLETTVGIEVVGDFMWMYEVELEDGRHVQAYKHRDTRCYVHLDADCNAFVYETPGRYRSIDIVGLLELVFDRLPGLSASRTSRSRRRGGPWTGRSRHRTSHGVSRVTHRTTEYRLGGDRRRHARLRPRRGRRRRRASPMRPNGHLRHFRRPR